MAVSPQQILVQPSVTLDQILKPLRKDGAVVLQNLLTLDQIQRFVDDTQEPLSHVQENSTYSDEKLRIFYGNKTKRLSDLTSVSPTFRNEILDHDLVHRICDAVFTQETGTYWLGGAEIVQVGPGEISQPLHRDQDEWPIFKLMGPSAPEACLNFLICISGFTRQNGATRMILGSNRWDNLCNCGDERETVPAIMNPGDCLLFSGKTVHGAGANHTDYQRLGLAMSIQCSYLTPEEAFPLHVKPETARKMSPRARNMVGLSSHFARDGTGLWQGINCTLIEDNDRMG